METYMKRQLRIAFLIYIGQILVGYSEGWLAPVAVKLQNPNETPLPEPLTDKQMSWVGSLLYPGAFIGSNIIGWLSNTQGRKPCLLTGGIFSMGAFLISATSVELWMLLVGRLLHGVGICTLYIVNLTYITEISSTNNRGKLLTATAVANAFGILLVYCIGPYVSFKVTCYIGVVIAMAFCVGTLVIPETPAFFAMKGKEIEAKNMLVFLGRASDIEDVLTEKNMRTKSKIQEWKDVFSVKSNRKALLITTVLLVSQQLSGIIPVTFFSTTIFHSSSSSIDPALATIIVGITTLVASCVTPLFIERVGRKILLLLSTAMCCVSLAAVGIYFYVEKNAPDFAMNVHWVPVASIVGYLLGYNLGFGIIPGATMSEMFDSSARGPGSALAFAATLFAGFINVTAFGYMNSALGIHVTFLFYAGWCAFAFGFTCVYFVETRGKTLTEIQNILSK